MVERGHADGVYPTNAEVCIALYPSCKHVDPRSFSHSVSVDAVCTHGGAQDTVRISPASSGLAYCIHLAERGVPTLSKCRMQHDLYCVPYERRETALRDRPTPPFHSNISELHICIRCWPETGTEPGPGVTCQKYVPNEEGACLQLD